MRSVQTTALHPPFSTNRRRANPLPFPMLDSVKKGADRLQESEPGHRFEARYHRLQAEREGRFSWGTIVNVCVGIVLLGLGVIFWFIPGPGWGFILLGLGFLGSESLGIARALDRLEVVVRRVSAPIVGWWQRQSLLLKALIGGGVLVGTGALGYGLLMLAVLW